MALNASPREQQETMTRRTKIVATIGPASSSEAMLRKLAEAGVNVFRLNFSHGVADDHRQRVDAIRKIEKEIDRPIAILQDLQGPKFRVGTFGGDETDLEAGQQFTFTLDKITGNSSQVTLPHPEIFRSVIPGNQLMVDDGKMRFEVLKVSDREMLAEVKVSGTLKNRKGVNLPGADIDILALTEKDLADAEVGKQLGVDWVALSFVQRPDDLYEARKRIGSETGLCAKIEKPGAIRHLDEIVALSDSIMVARGDLGVELPPETVPGHQRDIVTACRRAGKPVIVATQMLESMITAPTPTRAEASDVATAVFNGADAVMLSAESAAGDYPVESVETMARIITQTERYKHYTSIMGVDHKDIHDTIPHAVAKSASDLAANIRAKAIVVFTATGTTASRISRERPMTPMIAFVPDRKVAGRVALQWGMHPIIEPTTFDMEGMQSAISQQLIARSLAKEGDPVVFVAGFPFGQPGSTNMIRVHTV